MMSPEKDLLLFGALMVTIIDIEVPISVTDIQHNTMQAGATINVTITSSSFAAGANVTFEGSNCPDWLPG
jgi:predicted nicotinamide N-methyase